MSEEAATACEPDLNRSEPEESSDQDVIEGLKALDARLDKLTSQFDAKIRFDSAKEAAFDRLYRDLDEHREGADFAHKQGLVTSLLSMYDRIGEMLKAASVDPHRADLGNLQQDIVDALRMEEIELIEPETRLNLKTMQTLEVLSAASQEDDGVIAAIHRQGFAKRGRVLRAQTVSIYKFQQPTD
ncbi:MAG: nucleotide exchange factor GrpE [Fimbriimonadaceae bacterium]|nr:nucleotide exchange factor GrpE [Fimbriimonadaceae bacterium]QOJ10771.1 MAG: nucleotide exchange factor GrpE [Chthonomonadaceae bacterium]